MPKDILSAVAANERMELYYLANPGSPSAVRRPHLAIRSGVWVALLGESVAKGIAGFGATVEAALSAFDQQYFKAIHPPEMTAAPARIAKGRKPNSRGVRSRSGIRSR